jgi:hypothetical protein
VEKHQQNHNPIYSSLTLGTLNMMRLMYVVHFMGGKIRRMSMNVAFEHFCQNSGIASPMEELATLYLCIKHFHD